MVASKQMYENKSLGWSFYTYYRIHVRVKIGFVFDIEPCYGNLNTLIVVDSEYFENLYSA